MEYCGKPANRDCALRNRTELKMIFHLNYKNTHDDKLKEPKDKFSNFWMLFIDLSNTNFVPNKKRYSVITFP